jgi:hypothetical protein
LQRGPIEVTPHAPIATKGYTLEKIDELKKVVYEVIDSELRNHEHR